jgi:UDP-N-acetylmuramyl tripeptide synthase
MRARAPAARRRGARGRARRPHRLDAPAGTVGIELSLPGLYNVYNATAAASIALALGATPDEVRGGLEDFSAAFGRFERIATGTKTIIVLLIKNPAAANEALRTLETGVPPVLVVALNDGIADGRDVSWIWDVDFEPLLPHVARVIASGERAAELGLRLVYGGLPEERLEIVRDLEHALDRGLSLVEAGTDLVVLPTYTAMLALRDILTRRRLVQPYWEDKRQ